MPELTTHLHVVHGILQLLQTMGRAKSLQTDICQFKLLLPELCTQLWHNLVIPHLVFFNESVSKDFFFFFKSSIMSIRNKCNLVTSGQTTVLSRLHRRYNEVQNISSCVLLYDHEIVLKKKRKKKYPDDDAEVEGLIDETRMSPVLWTLGEEGVEDSGVAISSMSAYGPVGLEPFLLKALLKELRSCKGKKFIH